MFFEEIIMKRFILLFILISSSAAFAASYNAEATITKITVGATWMRVATTSMENNENCTSNSWFRINFSEDPDKAMYSAILAAKAAKQKIYFQLNGCAGDFPKITHVYVN